jgi:hypothetical protein
MHTIIGTNSEILPETTSIEIGRNSDFSKA